VPIHEGGRFREVEGVEDARRTPGIEDVVITAKPGQLMLPLPEGGSYLGFIFARAAGARDVVRALRASHAALRFGFERDVPVTGPRPA
jgi:hypothetical protein